MNDVADLKGRCRQTLFNEMASAETWLHQGPLRAQSYAAFPSMLRGNGETMFPLELTRAVNVIQRGAPHWPIIPRGGGPAKLCTVTGDW